MLQKRGVLVPLLVSAPGNPDRFRRVKKGLYFSHRLLRHLYMPRFQLAVLAGALLAGCALSGPSQDRTAYVQERGLVGKDSAYVLQERIYVGMPSDYALAALGSPHRRDTTATTGSARRVRYVYRSRTTSFDPRSDGFDPAVVQEGYVFVENDRVVDWAHLEDIPQLRAYYQHKSGAQSIRIRGSKQ